MDFYKRLHTALAQFKKDDAYRNLKTEKGTDSLINLASNDYLGLANNKELQQNFDSLDVKLSASSSRLLSGNHRYYDVVEEKLKQLYGSESALFFNSGYHLNIGVLPSLTTKNDLILADKLVHASLIEGFKLSAAKVIRYKHFDYTQLESLLKKYKDEFENIFIVSESIFSMDGDAVDIKKMVELKSKYSAQLYLDEAHAVGVIGDKGLGLAEKEGLLNQVDVLVGTMGKALASVGAYLICKKDVREYLINTCRSFIYTTALPPLNMAWTSYVLDILPEYNNQREALAQKSEYLRKKLINSGVEIVGESHILAIIIGDNANCMKMSAYLEERGVRVQAVRPPTVPVGTARIRISLHEKLSYSDLDKLVNIILEKEV